MKNLSLMWFRQDLRINDNPALLQASLDSEVMPIYIHEPDEEIGSASKWWLYNSLSSLNDSLKNSLNFYLGDSIEIINYLVKKYNIKSVYWNRRYEPKKIDKDIKIKKHLKDLGVKCESFNSSLLWEPWEVLKPDGSSYQVFTYFYRNGCLKRPVPRTPLDSNKLKSFFKDYDNKVSLEDLCLLDKINWHKKFYDHHKPGENIAQEKLNFFLKHNINKYKQARDIPSIEGCSMLSSHLHFGEISPHQIWHAVLMQEEIEGISDGSETFKIELAWREFSYYLLYHFQYLPEKNFNSKFDKFPWSIDKNALSAWKQGLTGYPIVDAGMRQIWQTGHMHNRVRMIVGSFLVKNLLIHWHHGKDWFFDCLVDADIASNSAGWQWIAGCGADAAPYFRIFNPVIQGERFDPKGDYVRKYIPEIASLPNNYIFKPWAAPKDLLIKLGIKLGHNYPLPIVELESSRNLALELYKNLSN